LMINRSVACAGAAAESHAPMPRTTVRNDGSRLRFEREIEVAGCDTPRNALHFASAADPKQRITEVVIVFHS
jgi:hypothetical protein